MIAPPRVFVSYSHDSAEHKAWVMDFATTLVNRGVDATVDQWDLGPGDDVPHFMETNLATCDFVVMVCTDRYVQKANAGAGGVGYEKMIMTQSLMKTINASKVIPIIRQNGTNSVPTFMGSKLYVDFSKDDENEFSLDELLRKLLGMPLYKKPEIGKNPFKPLDQSRPDRVSDGVKSVMADIAKVFEKKPEDTFHFSELLRATTMHRIRLDKYLEEVERLGLIARRSDFGPSGPAINVGPGNPSRGYGFGGSGGGFGNGGSGGGFGNGGPCFTLTTAGREYMFEHGIVPE